MAAPSLDGRVLHPAQAADDGTITPDTEFTCREKDDFVWARYRGGGIRHGHLVGTRSGDDLDVGFVELRHDGTTATGRGRASVSQVGDRVRVTGRWSPTPAPAELGLTLDEEEPLVHPGGVSLRPIVGEDGHRAVMRLQVAPTQTGFVASNAASLAQGPWEEPPGWIRGVWHEDRLVGFVMLADLRRIEGRWYLWRLMIDAAQQRAGYGRAVLELLCEHIRRCEPPHELAVSWVEGDGGPAPFYLGFGFEPTGEMEDDEVVARLVHWPERLPAP